MFSCRSHLAIWVCPRKVRPKSTSTASGVNGKDVRAYHTFLLTKTPEGCHIVTEEVVKGPGAIQFREQQPTCPSKTISIFFHVKPGRGVRLGIRFQGPIDVGLDKGVSNARTHNRSAVCPLRAAKDQSTDEVRTLASMIDEWGEPLQKALDTLIKDNLVRSVAVGPHAYYSAVPLAKEPLLPAIPEWLYCFHDKHPRSVPRDTEANTFVSCGVVLLAAVLTGSRDAELLEDLLRLPVGFIGLVLRLADTYQFWWSQRMFDLEAALRKNADDFADISDALHSVNEDFVLNCTDGTGWSLLHALRDRSLFGGSIERILDDEADGERLAS